MIASQMLERLDDARIAALASATNSQLICRCVTPALFPQIFNVADLLQLVALLFLLGFSSSKEVLCACCTLA